jgi:hypothetical protein
MENAEEGWMDPNDEDEDNGTRKCANDLAINFR